VGWIVAGIVLLGIVLVVLSAMSLTGRFRPLRRAVRRLNMRSEQVMRLQDKVAATQERAMVLAELADEAATRAAATRATFGQ
jgi:hypothetical protein